MMKKEHKIKNYWEKDIGTLPPQAVTFFLLVAVLVILASFELVLAG
ncbi:hypothetical protein QR692_10375 [Lactococcus petauri]|jgi:hypothetical protein|nr:hypothetical protein [Lactococcus petauri]USI65389.1 hypothetical protein LMK05_11260 [Lactococcus petauri]USI67884.1 hypothetical protein LMK04_10495 [Lactococcus petauri]WJE12545.1 hypothetical protein QR692_10375 [Lactococcus petauri]